MPWDIPAVAVFVAGTVFAWPTLGSLSLVGALVLGHFFLFCNVFRVRRSLELVWAALFLVNATVTLGVFELDAMLPMALAQLPVTAVVIGIELRSWRYHGVRADALNPELDRYLEWASERARDRSR